MSLDTNAFIKKGPASKKGFQVLQDAPIKVTLASEDCSFSPRADIFVRKLFVPCQKLFLEQISEMQHPKTSDYIVFIVFTIVRELLFYLIGEVPKAIFWKKSEIFDIISRAYTGHLWR